MCQIQTHYKGDIMEYILKNGIVYDPANEVNGEKMDVMFKDGKIVDSVSADAKVLDVTDKIVMPAGIDPHAHVAGPKLVVGRLYRPEDSRRGVTVNFHGRSLKQPTGLSTTYFVPSLHFNLTPFMDLNSLIALAPFIKIGRAHV